MNDITGIIGSPVFTDLDREFFHFLLEHGGGDHAALAGAIVCNRISAGDTCVNLGEIAGMDIAAVLSSAGPEDGGAPGEMLPPLKSWLASLKKSKIVGAPGDMKPLVLDGAGRLYLHRYWRYEKSITENISARLEAPPPEYDIALLRAGLNRHFPGKEAGDSDWQRVAALRALTGRFTVISGGPGTGKTSTVARIIALLLEQSMAENRELSIALAAPTGKAAARLRETLDRAFAPGGELASLDEKVRARFPRDAFTIHRLLRSIPGTPHFRHNAENPLPFDVVVVDESSMVDLALMAKLLSAVPAESRLILLGDRDQLASVEAGSVLGDICGGAGSGAELYSNEFATLAKKISGDVLPAEQISASVRPIQDAIVILEKSYRFNEGIGALSREINAGHSGEVISGLAEGRFESAELRPLRDDDDLARRIILLAEEGRWEPLVRDDPFEALKRFYDFMPLCALRRGPRGAETISAAIERHVLARSRERRREMYDGRPVMITRNDYVLGLFNGDIGIVRSGADGKFFACFPGREPDSIMEVSTPRLSGHETVYALTVHKSQGSEFSRAILILPDTDSPVLTRQLLYTAVTRARDGIEIWGSGEVLARAIDRPIRRSSGLRDALWD